MIVKERIGKFIAGNKKMKKIAANADVNVKDKYGWTPLMTAANIGDYEAVYALIKAFADVNAKNKRGETVLMKAKEEVKDLLRAHGAKEAQPKPTVIEKMKEGLKGLFRG